MVLACTRKDMRLFFKFVKVFTGLGELRVTLNDVILDPSTASRVSELALNPGRTEAEAKERELSAQTGAAGWMAPISKLFLPIAPVDRHATLVPPTNTKGTSRPPRFIPKLGPALAASATTVNVEFSGTGRSVTNAFSPQPLPQTDSHSDTVPGVMGIFAGAPRINAESDPWVVIPPVLQKSQSFRKKDMSTSTISRSIGRKNPSGLSRNVDAVIDIDKSQDVDEEESDLVSPLLERTLRRRGLSDSSIHSTFTSQADATPPRTPTRNHHPNIPSSKLPAWPDRSSVFQAFSRTVQNIRATAAGTMTPLTGPLGEFGAETFMSPRRPKAACRPITPAADSAPKHDHVDAPSLTHCPQTPTKIVRPKPIRIAGTDSEGGNILPHLSAWAKNTNMLIDPASGLDLFVPGSLRDESRIPRSWGRDERGHTTRDFF